MTDAGRIDLHAHITPAAYAAEVRRLGAVPDHGLPDWSVDQTIEMMDAWGTALAVLSLTPPGVYFGDQLAAGRLARSVNEEIAAVVRDRPDRFGGLAVLPLPDVGAALDELTYAFDELALDGVLLYTNVAGTYLGDPAWDPLFDELDRRRAFVLVHPGAPPYPSPIAYPNYLVEFPMDTTRAVVSLLYSGTLERCPDVRLLLSHLGGMVPFLGHRIRSLTLRTDAFDAKVPRGPLEYLAGLYYDTGLSANEAALRATLALTDAEHVVFGTDWPYAEVAPGSSDPQPVLATVFDDADREAVGRTNATVLVPRLAGAAAV
jgi:predicted TIM-barrel fold metal-dependent hydrolase